jgi:glucose uptake protein
VILPATDTSALILLVFSMLCLGSWVNAQKLSGKWRFELFYYDFSFGAIVCALVAAFTLGSMDSQELTFQDNLLIASRHSMAYAAGAGIVFNLGNMLLLGAVQASGMAVAFLIAFGLALAASAFGSYFQTPQINATLLLSGVALALAVVVLAGFAHSLLLESRFAVNKPLRPDPRSPRSPKPPSAALGIMLSVLGGILISLSFPLIDVARTGEAGAGPYGAALLFGGGMFLSTLLYSPFFMNFPVFGPPVEIRAYFMGAKKHHLLGFLGGIVWMAGTIAAFVSGSGPPATQPDRSLSGALPQAAALAAALWGLLAWRELHGATHRVKTLLTAALILLALGSTLVALAQFYSK